MVPKPVQRARRLIKKYGYNSPAEIDLIELLYAENLSLKYETTDAYQGKIVFNKYEGIITLSTNLGNEYQKRYVIAHEMGHFFNEKFKIRNYNPDIENRDARLEVAETRRAENAIRNEKLKKQRAGEERVQSEEIVHEFKRDRYHEFIDTNVKRFEELRREREANEYFNEKLDIHRGGQVRNDNPDIENRDAENAIRNDTSITRCDGQDWNNKLEIINDKLEKQRAGQVRVQSEEIVHEFKKDRYHDFMNMDENRFKELKREREANQFAVELLMARRWVGEVVRNKKPEIRTLKEIAEKFRVSLTAAALRYAELYKGAMAVILSVNKRVEWMACNQNFEYSKLNKYEPVPLNTRTYDIYDYLMPTNYIKNKRIRKCGYKQFMKEKTDYLDSLEETITVDSADWFGTNNNAENGYLRQIDFPMSSYNSVLTLMWGID